MEKEGRYIQPDNPTDEERYEMMKIALEEANHPEDFENLVELLSPPRDITTIGLPGSCKGIKVGIIGGGIAGLAAAFELRKLGFNITIFETQENRIGGRIYTHYFDKDKRFYGELGAMRIPVSHETTWHYINLLGVKTRPFIQSNKNAFIYVRNKRARNDPEGKSVMEKIYPEFNLRDWEKNTPWQKILGYALGTNFLKIPPVIRREILQVKKKYSMTMEYLDSLSIRKVLQAMNLSEGAMELISGIVPFLGAFYQNSYFENIQEEYTVDSAFRYEIVGGTINLPLAFYQSLMSERPKEYPYVKEENLEKVYWENGKTVTGIYKGNKDNKVILEYKSEKSLEISQESFDFVICAIPFSSLRNVRVYPMFSNEKMQSIKEVNYTSSQKTIFMCNERFWEKGDSNEKIVGGGSSTDLPIQTIWYPSYPNRDIIENKKISNNKNDFNYEGGVLLASYNLNQDAVRLGNLEDKTRFEEIKKEVEAVHGLPRGYLDSIVEDYETVQWDSEKGFYGAFCYFMPDQKSLFQYAMAKSEYDNKVHFAGEHISPVHGWIEGSVKTAMESANAIAEYCTQMGRNKL